MRSTAHWAWCEVPWFRLDDGFHSNPKVVAAGNEAIGLYVRCATYAAQHLTDGLVPEQIARLYGDDTLIDTLVKTKLWRRTRGGWRMPDFLEYNPSKQAVDNQRKDAAERQRRRREALSSQRDSRVSHRTPTRPVTTTDEASTTAAPPRKLPKHDFDQFKANGVVATRQPPPFAEAVQHALNPERKR